MNTKDVAGLLQLADAMEPEAQRIADTVRKFGAIVKPLFRDMILASAEIRADAFAYYVSRGLDRAEALQLCTADILQLSKAVAKK